MLDYYKIIPEFNSDGRLCNYHTGFRENETEDDLAQVPADEWERFNQLAGRQHKIVDGIIVYDETLALCSPEYAPPTPEPLEIFNWIKEGYANE